MVDINYKQVPLKEWMLMYELVVWTQQLVENRDNNKHQYLLDKIETVLFEYNDVVRGGKWESNEKSIGHSTK